MGRSTWVGTSIVVCMFAVAASGPAQAQAPQQNPAVPANFAAKVDNEAVVPLPQVLCARSALTAAPEGALAIVVIPGPLDNPRITYEIRNYAQDPISDLDINGFSALGGQGLRFNKAVATVGSVRVEYPRSGANGSGPIMLTFDQLGTGDCAAVETEAGTWGEPNFRGRVMDLVGARIQVVFEGGRRASGQVFMCGSNGRFGGFTCRPGDGVALITENQMVQMQLPR